MKLIMQIFLFSLMTLIVMSCNKDKDEINDTKEITGFIVKTGITTYQYGTHTISENGESFALRSSQVELDDFVGEEITIIGRFIEGYPVDGGPLYIEVEEIR